MDNGAVGRGLGQDPITKNQPGAGDYEKTTQPHRAQCDW